LHKVETKEYASVAKACKVEAKEYASASKSYKVGTKEYASGAKSYKVEAKEGDSETTSGTCQTQPTFFSTRHRAFEKVG